MSGNGYFRPTTPNLDALAKESLVFDNAFSSASWTLPESMTLYSGLYPFQHGVMNRYNGETLVKDTPTLIDLLNNAGYQTAAVTGGFDYDPKYGLTNRFSHLEKCFGGEGGTPTTISGDDEYGEFPCVVPKALRWLKEKRVSSSPFFLHIQGHDVHCPFFTGKGGKTYDKDYKGTVDFSGCLWTFDKTRPIIKDGKTYYQVYSEITGTDKKILLEEDDITHLIALYDESIANADKHVGFFLDEVKRMGLLDNTIIIFTSEHGDIFGKYGRFMRGGPLRGTFYDDVLHVPLFIRHPRLPAQRFNGLVSHVDVSPTLLSFLGLPPLPKVSGKSLLPMISDNKEVNDEIFAGSEFNPNANNTYFSQRTRIEAVRNKEWKLLKETFYESSESAKPREVVELYDLVNDKEELKNVADNKTFKQIRTDLEKTLDSWSKGMRRP